MPDKHDYIIHLRGSDEHETGHDTAYRLRRLLKIALRRFGFTCTAISQRPKKGHDDETRNPPTP